MKKTDQHVHTVFSDGNNTAEEMTEAAIRLGLDCIGFSDHANTSFDERWCMGTGQMVFGLAAVIIGSTIFKRVGFVKGTTAALVGSILYKACIQVAISLGLPANLLKLITAVLFLLVLVIGNLKKEASRHVPDVL